VAGELGIDLQRLDAGDEAAQKAAFVERVGAANAVAIGNGANDAAMLAAAALGICVLGGEGAATSAWSAADVVAGDIRTALGLLLHPRRLLATLRH
jgi:soluble P-type ATPase